jgi:uncharacterized protein
MPNSRCALVTIVLQLLLGAGFAGAQAQEVSHWTEGGRTLPWTYGLTLADEISGHSYEISIALPRDYALQPGSYPVLYVMDAGSRFGTITEISRANVHTLIAPGVIVVGIGYLADGHNESVGAQRLRDFTPVVDPLSFHSARPHTPIPLDREGADQMLRFIHRQVFPLIEAEFRADAENRALLGHSLAGLFTLYALLTRSEMFQNYIVSSPSLWWNQTLLSDLEVALVLPDLRGPTRLFMSIGGDEIPEGMIAPFERYVRQLEHTAAPNLIFGWRMIEGEDHGSVVPAAFNAGFRFVYRSSDEL